MTYQIPTLPSKEEKERARRLRKAAKKRKQADSSARKQAKLEKLIEARRAYAFGVKARLLTLDAQIAALSGQIGEEK